MFVLIDTYIRMKNFEWKRRNGVEKLDREVEKSVDQLGSLRGRKRPTRKSIRTPPKSVSNLSFGWLVRGYVYATPA